MERIFKLVPLRYDTHRDLSETKAFRTMVYGLKNMVELYKLGGSVEIPHIPFSKNTFVFEEGDSKSMCRRLMKRFDEKDFMNIYESVKDRIHNELVTLFNDTFYRELGYENFAFVCSKEGGFKVALGTHSEGFKIISVDENTYNLLLYSGKVFGEAECLAVRNELIK